MTMILAVVDPFPGTNQVHCAPGVTAEAGWSQDRPVCSVCLGDHRRHSFYALEGRPGLVGEPCLGAVIPDPPCVVITGGNLRDNAAFTYEGDGNYRVAPVARVVATAKEHFDLYGWERGVSAAQMLARWVGGESSVESPETFGPIEEWLLGLDEASATDYENALALLVKTGHVFIEQWGLAASMHQAYLRAERVTRQAAEERAAREAAVTGAWVGVAGEQVSLSGLSCDLVKSLGKSEDHPEWGERFLVRFIGPGGERIVWFTGEGGKFDPKPGESYNVRATVKLHDTYDNVRQTVLLRCREYDPDEDKPKPKKPRKRKGE